MATGDWLITGAQGMLARDVLACLSAQGISARAAGRDDVDVTDRPAVRAVFEDQWPAVVVNCAAWTAVDDAETHGDEAFQVNGSGPQHLAEACRLTGSVLLQLSTDYVFSGDARSPYAENATCEPRTAYGRGKLAGERAVLSLLPDQGYIMRTAWLYGVGGGNFVRTMIQREREHESLEVVDDQLGQPTWTADLADQLVRLGLGALGGTAPAGVYHGTSTGSTTWYGLTRELFHLLGADPSRVRPTTTAAFPRPAPRPSYSVLGHDCWKRAGLEPIRDWRLALSEAVPVLVAAERS